MTQPRKTDDAVPWNTTTENRDADQIHVTRHCRRAAASPTAAWPAAEAAECRKSRAGSQRRCRTAGNLPRPEYRATQRPWASATSSYWRRAATRRLPRAAPECSLGYCPSIHYSRPPLSSSSVDAPPREHYRYSAGGIRPGGPGETRSA